MTDSSTVGPLPAPGEWNSAVAHSLANPTHVLGPYEDDDDVTHVRCDGDGDPWEPSNCDFTTEAVRCLIQGFTRARRGAFPERY